MFQNFVPTLATLEPTRFSAYSQQRTQPRNERRTLRQARDRFRSAGAAKPAATARTEILADESSLEKHHFHSFCVTSALKIPHMSRRGSLGMYGQFCLVLHGDF